MGDQRVLYVLPKENVLFPATGRIREVLIEECTNRDDYSPVIIDGSHIYRIDSSTAKVNFNYILKNGISFKKSCILKLILQLVDQRNSTF